jgi:hypothetical protein
VKRLASKRVDLPRSISSGAQLAISLHVKKRVT